MKNMLSAGKPGGFLRGSRNLERGLLREGGTVPPSFVFILRIDIIVEKFTSQGGKFFIFLPLPEKSDYM